MILYIGVHLALSELGFVSSPWVMDVKCSIIYAYTCTQTCANSCKEIHCQHTIFEGNYANFNRLKLILVVLSPFPQSNLEFCPCIQFLFTMKILSQLSVDNQFISPFSLCSETWDNVGIGGGIHPIQKWYYMYKRKHLWCQTNKFMYKSISEIFIILI